MKRYTPLCAGECDEEEVYVCLQCGRERIFEKGVPSNRLCDQCGAKMTKRDNRKPVGDYQKPRCELTITVAGEPGTGKPLIARAIYDLLAEARINVVSDRVLPPLQGDLLTANAGAFYEKVIIKVDTTE